MYSKIQKQYRENKYYLIFIHNVHYYCTKKNLKTELQTKKK